MAGFKRGSKTRVGEQSFILRTRFVLSHVSKDHQIRPCPHFRVRPANQRRARKRGTGADVWIGFSYTSTQKIVDRGKRETDFYHRIHDRTAPLYYSFPNTDPYFVTNTIYFGRHNDEYDNEYRYLSSKNQRENNNIKERNYIRHL